MAQIRNPKFIFLSSISLSFSLALSPSLSCPLSLSRSLCLPIYMHSSIWHHPTTQKQTHMAMAKIWNPKFTFLSPLSLSSSVSLSPSLYFPLSFSLALSLSLSFSLKLTSNLSLTRSLSLSFTKGLPPKSRNDAQPLFFPFCLTLWLNLW